MPACFGDGGGAQIAEVAVVGVPDAVYGQLIAVVVSAKPGAQGVDRHRIQSLCREELPPYKLPRKFVFVEAIPRNAMGKVNKKELVAKYFPPKLQSNS
jgi:acyl-CoA synthetase (AMP-forming)/AMP-acid ligase II